jgi:hypothetical protein
MPKIFAELFPHSTEEYFGPSFFYDFSEIRPLPSTSVQYVTEETSRNDPPGCFWYDFNNQVYFNHAYGPRDAGGHRRVVCYEFCDIFGEDCDEDDCCPDQICQDAGTSFVLPGLHRQ